MLTKTPSPPLSIDVIKKALGEFGLEASADQISAMQRYISMLLAWNDKVNLTAIREPVEILYRHFCESMFAAVAVPLSSGRLADVGSGGGFPGIPIKIMRPELQVFLIESNIKKATFLAEIVRELILVDTPVLVSRYEELGEEVAPLDIACSRALGEFGRFLTWAGSPRVGARQAVLWIGGQDVDQVQRMGGWEWRKPIPIPQSLRRYLLVGDKISSPEGS